MLMLQCYDSDQIQEARLKMSKKIGLLTIHKVKNYGAVLQGYALQQTINSLGVKCEIIDLLRPEHKDYISTPKSTPLQSYFNMSNVPKSSWYISIKKWLKNKHEIIVKKKSENNFNLFDKQYLTYSKNKYHSVDELYAATLGYDAVVVGSDQVWNPTFKLNPEPYFLTFLEKGVPRIAYAPSFGISALNEDVYEQYKEWIKNISYLSVREKHGASLIKELTGRDAKVVLDPTLLLSAEQWSRIAKKTEYEKPYIFCYVLLNDIAIEVLCNYLKKYTGYHVYIIRLHPRLIESDFKAVNDAGPLEFLGWIRNAEMVITNSFHGMLFAINMQKPFYVVLDNKNNNSRNSRFENILELLDMKDRLWRLGDAFPESKKIEISFDNAAQVLTVERKKSLEFLTSAIFDSIKEQIP